MLHQNFEPEKIRWSENEGNGIFSLLRKFVQGHMYCVVSSSCFIVKAYIHCSCRKGGIIYQNAIFVHIFILVPRTQFNVTVLLACIILLWFHTQHFKGETTIWMFAIFNNIFLESTPLRFVCSSVILYPYFVFRYNLRILITQ